MEESEDIKWKRFWENSEFWPHTAEQETFASGGTTFNSFGRFCPEVTYERFRVFASDFTHYYDSLDRSRAHNLLAREGVDKNDWRWNWETLTATHYSDCALYSPLSYQMTKQKSDAAAEKILTLKPTFYGVSLDLAAAWKKIIQWLR